MTAPSDSIPRSVRLTLLCFSLLFFTPLHAQQTSPLSGAAASHAPEASPIVLDVVVTDSAGRPVGGLDKQDFSITENNHPEPLLSFKAVPPAPTAEQAIFVLDEVNMAFGDVSRARGQLATFLRSSGTLPLPVTILLLTDTSLASSGEPSRDGKTLADDLNHAASGLRSIRRSAGFDGDLERVNLSLRALRSLVTYEAQKPGRKLVIWLSPGWPYLAYPGTNYSARDAHDNFATITKLSADLRNARITLYSADPRGLDDANGFQTTYYKTVLKGVRKQKDASSSALGLQVLAYQSGGLVLNSSNDLAPEIAACLRDATSYYVLSIASAPAEREAVYHELTVKLGKPYLTARTRAGYYSQP